MPSVIQFVLLEQYWLTYIYTKKVLHAEIILKKVPPETSRKEICLVATAYYQRWYR